MCKKEKPTFFTHTPGYYQPGTKTDYGIVQKLERVENTSLYNGGSIPCYAVYCEPHAKAQAD